MPNNRKQSEQGSMIPRTEETAMYDLGRKARQGGFGPGSCNVRDPIKKSWWLAGWHDLDMEKGVTRYFRDYKEAA